MNEYIRKEDASDAVIKHLQLDYEYAWGVREAINALPSADVVPTEPQEIGYDQCANAMLKMWIDNVVTDGEYNRIMDRLNKLYFGGGERKE